MQTHDNTDPGRVKAPLELIKPGNKPGDDGNWRWTFDGDDVVRQFRVLGVWVTEERTSITTP